jgi:outer membrane protein OmpA-like peptidoglycan-associated protein
MSWNAPLPIAAAAVLGAVALSGCATKDYVREQVAGVDRRVDAVDGKVSGAQGRIDQHDTRLAALDQTSREALERATAAGKLAEGKFLYSMVLSDDSVKFPVRRATLSTEAEARLMEFVEKLKSENRNVYLEVQGHTDSKGSEDFNRRLGQDRAEAVRLFMNQHGVALNRISTISYGASAPVASNATRTGRAQNRRVVIIVLA